MPARTFRFRLVSALMVAAAAVLGCLDADPGEDDRFRQIGGN